MFEEFFLNCRSSDSDYNNGSDSESETKSDSDSDIGNKSVKSKTHSCVVYNPQISGKW